MNARAWLLAISIVAAGAAAAGCSGAPAESEDVGAAHPGAGGGPPVGTGGSGAGAATSASSSGGGAMAEPCEVDGVHGGCVHLDDCVGALAVPGICEAGEAIQCCVTEPIACDPDLAVQPNGGLEPEPGTGGCPDGMVRIESFCIDRYEASLERLDGLPWSPFFNPGNVPVRAVSVPGAVPQAYVSGEQAAAACEAAGKRLCTDDEWLRACGGPTGTTYPYGDELLAGACNDARAQHPAIEYFGTTDDWIWNELDNACLDQLPDSLDPTGANLACVTAEGVFDMMGNLHEWTADPAGTFRGGFFVDTKLNGPGCLYVTTAHDAGYWDYSTGFRCCAD